VGTRQASEVSHRVARRAAGSVTGVDTENDGKRMRSPWSDTFAATPETAARVRATVADLLGPSMPPDDLFELRVSVGEAVANAIEHGRGPIQIDIELTARQATVTVSDRGNGFDPKHLGATGSAPSLDAESGRGLYIMRQMSDSLAADDGRGCAVSIVKSFVPSRLCDPEPAD
jgi:anti-sigma regulatory factor (Ser/Thr protein kinase)